MAVVGRAALQSGERFVERQAEGGGAGGAVELVRERAVVPPADLGERPGRAEPRGDRDPQQVEHVPELRVDRV